MPTVFDSLRDISSRPKVIRLADPDDILSTTPRWSPDQERMSQEERGAPANGYTIEIKPGASTIDFTVRRLTAAQREQCDRVLDAVQPPEITEPKRGKPGEPPVNVRVGFDFDHPKYQADLREARSRQSALVALYGVDGLRDSVSGETDEEKVAAIRETLDERLIVILAAEIWSRTYSGGDPADFFTSANSSTTQKPGSSPSAPSSPSPRRRGKSANS